MQLFHVWYWCCRLEYFPILITYFSFFLSCVCADPVFSSGPGVRDWSELRVGEEVLWSGLSGERQPTEILLRQSVWHQSEWTWQLCFKAEIPSSNQRTDWCFVSVSIFFFYRRGKSCLSRNFTTTSTWAAPDPTSFHLQEMYVVVNSGFSHSPSYWNEEDAVS